MRMLPSFPTMFCNVIYDICIFHFQELVNNFDAKNETTLSRIDFGAPVDLPQEERMGAAEQGGTLRQSQAQVTGPVAFR